MVIWYCIDASLCITVYGWAINELVVIRVLLIGCGDVALRTADLLRGRARLYGLTRRAEDVPKLRGHGVVPIVGDLDALRSLDRLRAALEIWQRYLDHPESAGDRKLDGRDVRRHDVLKSSVPPLKSSVPALPKIMKRR